MGAGDQFADHRHAGGIAQLPQVLVLQLGLARMQQVAAAGVEGEEVAVDAVVHLGEQAQRLPQGLRVVAAGVVQRREHAARHADQVEQLGFLGGNRGRLDHLSFAAQQVLLLPMHRQRDQRERQQQRQDRQQQELRARAHDREGQAAQRAGVQSDWAAW